MGYGSLNCKPGQTCQEKVFWLFQPRLSARFFHCFFRLSLFIFMSFYSLTQVEEHLQGAANVCLV